MARKNPPRSRKLAFGAKVAKSKASGGGTRDLEGFFDVVMNFSQEIRTEIFNDFYDDLRKYALAALIDSNAKSTSPELAPDGGNLYNSIKAAYNGGKDSMQISVGGEGRTGQYANVRDRKKGEYTTISPKGFYVNRGGTSVGPFLVFTLYRNARVLPTDVKLFYAKPVQTPGSYFFTGSWKKAMRNINRNLTKWIKFYNSNLYEGTVYKVGINGQMVYRGGNKSIAQLRSAGKIDKAGNVIKPTNNIGARRAR